MRNDTSDNHDQTDPTKETLLTKDAVATRKITIKDENERKIKKKHRNKCDYGDNFVAPDGGWGWLVAIAGGLNMMVAYALLQNFGIFYSERMMDLGITSSELTTIINIEMAMSTISGLLNGPLYRRYSYRQVAFLGSFVISLGLFLCIFANSFIFYIIAFSIFYGFGCGLILSASSMAVIIYFKEKRRTATAYQFGVAGLGRIFLPYLATFLMQFYGVRGSVLIFSGITLHTFACSLIFQPVQWHVKKRDDKIHQESQPQEVTEMAELNIEHKAEPIVLRSEVDCLDRSHLKNAQNHNNTRDHDDNYVSESPQKLERELTQEKRKKRSFFKKIAIVFDLYLLLDISYINLAFGLTLVFFVEVNFGILTPFILADFGLTKSQIASTMSINAFSDLVTRFLIPVVTAKMNFSNKTYFLCGVVGTSLGRVVLSVTRNYYIILGAFLWIGLSKAFRFIFWFLILPDYVPLKRLPAAWGLHFLMASIFSLAVGPIIGLIRDKTNYAFTLHFFNGLCLVMVLMWIFEELWRKLQPKTKLTSI